MAPTGRAWTAAAAAAEAAEAERMLVGGGAAGMSGVDTWMERWGVEDVRLFWGGISAVDWT